MADNLMYSKFNPMKILYYGKEIKELVESDKIPIPATISFDFSNPCQHGCPWCSWKEHRKKDAEGSKYISVDIVKSIADECKQMGVPGYEVCGGGEPLLHEDAPELLRILSNAGTLYLVTNGSRLTDECAKLAKMVRVSLDSGTAETHKKLHRTNDFSTIIENITSASKFTKTGLGFLVHPENYTEIITATKLAKEIGCTYIQIRPCFIEEWFPWIQTKDIEVQDLIRKAEKEQTEDFRVYATFYKTVPKRDWKFKRCYAAYFNPLVTPSNSVWMCCERRGVPDSKIGEIGKDGSFSDIWFSERHIELMKKVPNHNCPAKDKFLGYNNIIWNCFVEKNVDMDYI